MKQSLPVFFSLHVIPMMNKHHQKAKRSIAVGDGTKRRARGREQAGPFPCHQEQNRETYGWDPSLLTLLA